MPASAHLTFYFDIDDVKLFKNEHGKFKEYLHKKDIHVHCNTDISPENKQVVRVKMTGDCWFFYNLCFVLKAPN